MRYIVKGKAKVTIYWNDECECCGGIVEKEDSDSIWISEEVVAPTPEAALETCGYKQKITGAGILRQKGEEIWFDSWEVGPSVSEVPMETIMRRRGEAELF